MHYLLESSLDPVMCLSAVALVSQDRLIAAGAIEEGAGCGAELHTVHLKSTPAHVPPKHKTCYGGTHRRGQSGQSLQGTPEVKGATLSNFLHRVGKHKPLFFSF